MRTTIDLPDTLFQRAKLVALERQVTLKTLITRALQSELDGGHFESRRMNRPPIPVDVTPFAPALSNAEVARLMENEDLAKSGR